MILLLCACSDEITDYEDYFSDYEIEFDDEISSVVNSNYASVDAIAINIDNYSIRENPSTADRIYDQSDVTAKPVDVPKSSTDSSAIDETDKSEELIQDDYLTDSVWIPKSGKKFHCKSDCSNMKSPQEVSESAAINMGYTPCKRCFK